MKILAVLVILIALGAGMVHVSSNLSPSSYSEGTINVKSFDLPESSFLSEESRAALKRFRDIYQKEWSMMHASCPSLEEADKKDMHQIRLCRAADFYDTSFYENLRSRYDVTIAPETIGGVYTEVFSPAKGIEQKNTTRVLINLHGGAFYMGSRWVSHLESIPVASVGRIKVVSIDYRMGPEHRFPAASEDVAEVYQELLKEYKAENIGIYGCSAGGAIAAQSISWFLKKNLPLPGAIGIFCAGALTGRESESVKWQFSDGAYINGAVFNTGEYIENWAKSKAYFEGVSMTDPLVSPGGYDDIMSQFPPTLVISSTRDYALSLALNTHLQLTRLGVESRLHVWEGLAHGFYVNPELSESREATNVIVRFFDEYLGR